MVCSQFAVCILYCALKWLFVDLYTCRMFFNLFCTYLDIHKLTCSNSCSYCTYHKIYRLISTDCCRPLFSPCKWECMWQQMWKQTSEVSLQSSFCTVQFKNLYSLNLCLLPFIQEPVCSGQNHLGQNTQWHAICTWTCSNQSASQINT